MCRYSSLIVQSAAVVAVTWPAAVHVIGQAPMLRLQEKNQEMFVFLLSRGGARLILGAHHTVVAGVSLYEALAEAASCV